METKLKNRFSILFCTILLSGCATSNKDILSKFAFKSDQQQTIESDLKACEANAYNAGYTRRGGLLNEGGRVEFIETCLEKKQWARK